MDISTENAALIERGHYQIETFLMRFGNDYQDLLDYAAIPVVITPELLNYLRMEFTPKLPWVAEVDLLLSDLFRVVGYEQYAMQSYVRAVLLEGLDASVEGSWLNKPLHPCEEDRCIMGGELEWRRLYMARPNASSLAVS